ncbi:MAG: ATP phosphoribosyltransferase regulatory subunit [Candidatus Pacebacteria bacterium]|nr:ATP phosphoribosyltransferase regulatory subunit [Candidatus Paceibacterota bacterium]
MSQTIDKIDEVAKHYGFKITRERATHLDGDIFLRPEEKMSILRNYSRADKRKEAEVAMLYHNQALLTNNRLRKKTFSRFKNFNFDIFGVSNGIAEATIIHTAVAALNEEGFENVCVDINSAGDKESFLNFKNGLFEYYKNHTAELHPNCRTFHKKNVFDLLFCPHKECRAVREDAPKPIYFLSNESQKHLREILEYLESMRIAYRINNFLLSRHNYFSKIIFEIKTEQQTGGGQREEILLGRGGRYDELAKKIIRKRNALAVGISLGFKQIKNNQTPSIPSRKPKFYFIQFGQEAKLRSLPIIELLRGAQISIRQDLHINKFSEQIEIAKKLKMPYAIILGQKEAVENTIIVKDLREVTQKVVKINDLLPYLKQLR